MNDSALVDGLRRHDPLALKHFRDCFLPTVWRFVYVRVKGDRHLAEDIVSESVLALLKAISDPELEIGHPVAWLRSVAANKVADHFRAVARVQHLIDQAKQIQPESSDEDAAAGQELQERREEIRDVLWQLPEQSRLALEWKYVDKVSVREIADRLGVTEKAAESILFRGRREFRQRMLLKGTQEEIATDIRGCGCPGGADREHGATDLGDGDAEEHGASARRKNAKAEAGDSNPIGSLAARKR